MTTERLHDKWSEAHLDCLVVRSDGIRSFLGGDDDSPQCVGHPRIL